MANLELTRLSGSTYVIKGPTNIGACVAESGYAILVDSGNDDESGRKVLRSCEAANLRVGLIANTHSNADHCGGNSFIQARTNCRIAAPREESAFIENPTLEPAFLWGGFPLPPLRNKFLVAKSSRVTDMIQAPCRLPGTDIEARPLPGHYLGMVGFLTTDKVFFVADAAASPAILQKYSFYFVYDVAAHLSTLDLIAQSGAEWIVPSHSEPVQDATALVEANRAKILEVGDRIAELCQAASTPEMLVAALADSYGLVLNHTQYVLLGSTLRSYVAWLADQGIVTTHIEANRLIIERKSLSA